MHPHSYKFVQPEQGLFTVVKVDEEWRYQKIMVEFQDDIPHGGVGIVETMVQKLGTMLGLESSSSPDRAVVVIDFLSPVGEYMTSEDLIGILTRNLSHVTNLNLHLGGFMGDILARERARILEPGPAMNVLCRRLRQAMPKLDWVDLW
ncbi:hypothetical protein K435DRAFT_401216 [Dendrothele bispora CBS 962.96]|uniref:Uncharacterized protein n=1 Tax=Dendrothele bispora (strain CBS 962.96) TaxID=1314807 RepID=A0A4S8MFI2_DENBC|nr:hypothetical protein K435DRAFT_401216 [Dendrothele bispora CBS 962.96]